MSSITDGFRDAFLAGVGAVALGAEKSKELVDQLIAKGEITVDQGKQLNEELKHHAVVATTNLREDAIASQMAAMTAEERAAFVAKVAEMAATVDAKQASAAGKADAEAEAEVIEVVDADTPEAADAQEGETPAQ